MEEMMRFVGIFVLLCLFMAAARLVVIGLALAFIVTLLWGALTRPARAFGFMALLVTAKVVEMYPIAAVAFLALCAVLLRNQTKGAEA